MFVFSVKILQNLQRNGQLVLLFGLREDIFDGFYEELQNFRVFGRDNVLILQVSRTKYPSVDPPDDRVLFFHEKTQTRLQNGHLLHAVYLLAQDIKVIVQKVQHTSLNETVFILQSDQNGVYHQVLVVREKGFPLFSGFLLFCTNKKITLPMALSIFCFNKLTFKVKWL